MRIEDILRENCVLPNLVSTEKQDVLRELVGGLKQGSLISDVESVVRVIEEREKLGSTGIGDGVAIPHGKMKNIDNILCVFGRSRNGVDFDSVDDKPAHIFFLLVAPENAAGIHLKFLSRISRILRDSSFRKHILELPGAHDIFTAIIEEDRKY